MIQIYFQKLHVKIHCSDFRFKDKPYSSCIFWNSTSWTKQEHLQTKNANKYMCIDKYELTD
jgi:hypothetical protein